MPASFRHFKVFNEKGKEIEQVSFDTDDEPDFPLYAPFDERNVYQWLVDKDHYSPMITVKEVKNESN